jgi:hypothetical protein
VRTWRRRSQHQGRIGLSSQMGRPTTGVLSTLAEDMRDSILHLRRTHPGWGPDTLLAELRVDPRWTHSPLPSRSRIAALLKAAKLTRRFYRPQWEADMLDLARVFAYLAQCRWFRRIRACRAARSGWL